MINSVKVILYSPTFLSKLYFTLSPRQRKARVIIEKYVYQMIDHEISIRSESTAERKGTSLIASLVNALGDDEQKGKGR